MRKVIYLLIVLTIGITILPLYGCSDKEVVITIDGGGALGDFNTSLITGYDTLEKLANEYMELHKGVKIKINRYSMNGEREDLLSRLTVGTAPDIIFQIPTSLAEDLGKGFYVVMDEYLEKPNPYIEGNQKWKDIYDSRELEATRGPDGSFYFICLERAPAGIAYNKEIFAAAGITKIPETYSEFLHAQKMIYQYDSTIKPFLPEFDWYKIILETSIFAKELEKLDTIRPNGLIDTEEFCKAYSKGLWSPDSDLYREFLFFCGDKTKYYPAGWNTSQINREYEFVNGKIAMYEVNGRQLFSIYNDPEMRDKVGYFGYPILDLKANYMDAFVDQNDIDYLNIPEQYKIPENERYGVLRGFSGLSTGWWITNTAIRNNTVETCVDFLMFLTAPQNNNRLIGDKGNSLPISSDAPVPELLRPLVDLYNADLQNEKMFTWGAINSNSKINKYFADQIQNGLTTYRNSIYSGNNPNLIISIDNNAALDNYQNIIINAARESIETLMQLNNWKAERWN